MKSLLDDSILDSTAKNVNLVSLKSPDESMHGFYGNGSLHPSETRRQYVDTRPHASRTITKYKSPENKTEVGQVRVSHTNG